MAVPPQKKVLCDLRIHHVVADATANVQVERRPRNPENVLRHQGEHTDLLKKEGGRNQNAHGVVGILKVLAGIVRVEP